MNKKKNKCINPCELTAAITAAGNLIAKDLSDDELNLLSAAFMQLADVFGVIAAVRALNEADCPAKAVSAGSGNTSEVSAP
ncbi:MAG: hypothetical protein LBC82_03175 [Oscillospiraceae bacterium]|jgi:hypothetical protein|nr:hypothetical protein [Oscillospiraceae bacterium]